MPTSQWLDKDVGLGYSSIYNAGGNVGIHTNDPRLDYRLVVIMILVILLKV